MDNYECTSANSKRFKSPLSSGTYASTQQRPKKHCETVGTENLGLIFRNGRKSFLPKNSFPHEEKNDISSDEEEGSLFCSSNFTTVRNMVAKNKDKIASTDKSYRRNIASKNPVLVVASSKIRAWDKLPRVGMINNDIRKIYPPIEVKGFMND
jgi:hypothetical protein